MEYITPDWYDDPVRLAEFKSNLAPIVLFTYNRLDHTKQTVEALQKNIFAEDSLLYIYSDAPKNEKAIESVNAVREYLHGVTGFKGIYIIEREENWGLARNIIDGVTKIVNKYGKIIVVEDDIVTSSNFLKYMNDALELYKDMPRVMEINAYTYPIEKEGLPEQFFLGIAGCWGWATWDRAWKYFKRDPENVRDSFSEDEIHRFTLEGNWPDVWEQVLANCDGRLYTWAVFWFVAIFKQNGLTLWPRDSIAANVGMDGSGEHCGATEDFNQKINTKKLNRFPKNASENNQARQAVGKWYYEFAIKHRPSLLRRALHSIKIAIWGDVPIKVLLNRWGITK